MLREVRAAEDNQENITNLRTIINGKYQFQHNINILKQHGENMITIFEDLDQRPMTGLVNGVAVLDLINNAE